MEYSNFKESADDNLKVDIEAIGDHFTGENIEGKGEIALIWHIGEIALYEYFSFSHNAFLCCLCQ